MNRIATLLSILGLAAAVYLSRLYYATHAGTAGFRSACNLNATFNCDLVTSTKYATLMPGVPLSSVVAGWFLALLLISLAAMVDDWRKDAVRVGLILSAIGSIYGIGLIFVMVFALKTFCLFCLAIDFANFGLLAIFWRQVPSPKLEHLGVQKWGGYATLVAASLFFATILIQQSMNTEAQFSKEDEAYTIDQVFAQAPAPLTPPPSTPFLGNPDAKVTIYEMSDYQCPHCQRGAFLVNTLLNLYPKEIRVGFLHFPLDQACNREMKSALHPFACKLARGATCAERAGKFREYHEGIFEDQENLKDDSAQATLERVGVDAETAKACLESEEAKKVIGANIEWGLTNKVGTTPTFFLNGRKIEGALPLGTWQKMIAREIAGGAK